MSDIDPEATAHRTLDIGIAKLPYNLVDLPEHYADLFRKAGARTAYTYRDKKLVTIMYKIKKDQDFVHYATRWEKLHSCLIHGEGSRGKVFPVVNEDGLIVGHYGEFRASDIYTPPVEVQGQLNDLVDRGVPIFVDQQANLNSGSTTRQAAQYMAWSARDTQNKINGYSQYKWYGADDYATVVTDPNGYVRAVVSIRDTDGLVPVYYSPADLIAVPRLFLLIGRVTAKRIILALVRRRAGRDLARGAARELAAGATKALKLSLPIKDNPTYVNVGQWMKPGNLIAEVKDANGEITYRVKSIVLRGEEEAVSLARTCHREMIKRAAEQAKKAGKQRFTFYGVDAGHEFRRHADKLAREIGIPGSGKIIKGSPLSDYHVTLLVEKVLK